MCKLQLVNGSPSASVAFSLLLWRYHLIYISFNLQILCVTWLVGFLSSSCLCWDIDHLFFVNQVCLETVFIFLSFLSLRYWSLSNKKNLFFINPVCLETVGSEKSSFTHSLSHFHFHTFTLSFSHFHFHTSRSEPDDSLQNCQPPLVKVCMVKIWSRLTKVISGTPEICFLSNFFFWGWNF